MKRTSPWFILLFPVAIPAIIVLDFFGYRIIAFILAALVVLSFALYLWSVAVKFRSLRKALASVAEALFDNGSWTIRHYPYHHTLSGTVAGRPFHYSLLGHGPQSPVQLFLDAPVSRAASMEQGPDASNDPVLNALGGVPGFMSARLLPRPVPLLQRLLTGMVGSGGPGIVLRKQVENPFETQALAQEIALMKRAADESRKEP